MMKRLFIATDISSEARAKAADYIDQLKHAFPGVRVGWEKAEKLHLTLKFIGEASPVQTAKLVDAVERVASGSSRFELSINGCGVFPTSNQPRILWLGVDGEPERLVAIREELESQCEVEGFPKENRRYHPHLTIARVREPERASGLAKSHLGSEFESDSFEVDSLIIFESRLDHRGSTYSVLKRIPFSG